MESKRSLFSWALSRYRGLQLLLLVLIVCTIFFRVFPLEMQKRIVNVAIRFRDVNSLFLYCGLYLGAVVLAGLLKYVINVLQGYIGQKILNEMRTTLYDKILRLPLPFFRKTPPGMVISSLTSEMATIGDFLGSAVAVPVVSILTLLAFAGYMFYLNSLLAILSLSIYPFEVMIIPFLQKKVNQLNSERINENRSLSNAVGEAVSGIHEIHGNAGFPIENEKVSLYSERLLRLRHRINVFKYLTKFVNNFFQSLGPFLLFLVGGYLAIQGRFNLGELVAFLSAYEKLYDPWKELMDYYQSLQDSRVRYRRIMEAFDVEPEFALKPTDREPLKLEGRIEVQDVSYEVDGNIRLLDQISLELQPGERLALVGLSGSGKSTLAMVMGQLYNYNRGHVLVDGRELKELSKLDVSRNMSFVAQHPFIFDGTIRENIVYACRSLMLSINGGGEGGYRFLPDEREILEVVERVGLTEDVLKFGLNRVVTRECCGDLAEKLVVVRHVFHKRWGRELEDVVEFFQEDRYHHYSTVAANLISGFSNREDTAFERLAANKRFVAFLKRHDLYGPLLDLGVDVATQTVALLRDLKEDPFFFEQSPISRDEIDAYGEVVDRLGKEDRRVRYRDDEQALLKLALLFIPARHKMAALPQSLRNAILKARPELREYYRKEDPEAFTFVSVSKYVYIWSLLENILFGRIKDESTHAQERIVKLVVDLLKAEGLYNAVLAGGLEFQVGSQGDRLSGGQKQKVALARALLKAPTILILDEATASLDMASQGRIQRYLDTDLRGRSTLVNVVHRLELIRDYEKIAVMKAGRIVEMGRYDELMKQKGLLYELVHG